MDWIRPAIKSVTPLFLLWLLNPAGRRADTSLLREDYERVAGLRGHRAAKGKRAACRGLGQVLVYGQYGRQQCSERSAAWVVHQQRGTHLSTVTHRNIPHIIQCLDLIPVIKLTPGGHTLLYTLCCVFLNSPISLYLFHIMPFCTFYSMSICSHLRAAVQRGRELACRVTPVAVHR